VKKKYFLIIIFSLTCLNSCSFREGTELLLWILRKTKETKEENQEEKLTFEEASRQVDLWWAIETEDVDKVKQYLKEGYDPNRCRGEEGWMVKTPLNVIARSSYDTFARKIREEEIPDPPPDVEMLRLLVEAGADVNQRPYIWCRICTYDNSSLRQVLRNNTFRGTGRIPHTEVEKEEMSRQNIEDAKLFVGDTNRVIEAFLKAGADPDKRGHPYPYSLEAKRNNITDKEAEKYFAKGTRPINEAIKKGMWWESQVDLLLQYTTLDKDSLKAAKESKDPAMIEKINKLWKEQNAGKK